MGEWIDRHLSLVVGFVFGLIAQAIAGVVWLFKLSVRVDRVEEKVKELETDLDKAVADVGQKLTAAATRIEQIAERQEERQAHELGMIRSQLTALDSRVADAFAEASASKAAASAANGKLDVLMVRRRGDREADRGDGGASDAGA